MTRNKCESQNYDTIEQLVPILHENAWYMNIYCAECHGVNLHDLSETHIIEANITCKDDLAASYSDRTAHVSQDDVLLLKSGTWNLRSSEENDLSSCAQGVDRNSCERLPQELTVYKHEIHELCLSYVDYVTYEENFFNEHFMLGMSNPPGEMNTTFNLVMDHSSALPRTFLVRDSGVRCDSRHKFLDLRDSDSTLVKHGDSTSCTIHAWLGLALPIGISLVINIVLFGLTLNQQNMMDFWI
ncbi:hypothetical protein CAPTEDRAFT_190130 [Capitella teleta]|uniref:Uncharacterized protein n=1 Tax=Capitella teleta TaxID=283909 RepID=R7UM86_CAPTE|nr:hypothetical protein CAPTEDRAFT_190130 [Capitella teleta]|eukprot:ELU07208.1 hypothetical protein CAPTEDRAFT_190130 [Capitella teleta]